MHLFFPPKLIKIRVNEADQDARADEKFLPRPDWTGMAAGACPRVSLIGKRPLDRPTYLTSYLVSVPLPLGECRLDELDSEDLCCAACG